MKTFTINLLLVVCSLSANAQFTTVATGLASPAGVETDAQGNHWVTETGTGTNNGRVVVIKPNGTKIPVVTGLPSHFDAATNETAGAWRTMFLKNKQLAIIVGEGNTNLFGRIMVFNFNRFKLGVTAAKTVADTAYTIEISRFSLAQTGVTNSNPFSAALDERGNWYVADAGANMIVKVARNGVKSVFARFPKVANPTPVGPPMMDAVPTKIVAKKGGGFYVSTLTGFPFLAGKATIYELSAQGTVSVYATGLTTLTDLILDSHTGDLYALQIGTFGFVPTPGFALNSGKVWKIKARTRAIALVADQFGPGAGMSFDRHGNLYVTNLVASSLVKKEHAIHHFSGNQRFLAPIDDENAEIASNVTLFPNPASDFLTIDWGHLATQTPQAVRLIDVTGRVVFEKNGLEGNILSQMDLQGLTSGVYLVQLNTLESVETHKIKIQK